MVAHPIWSFLDRPVSLVSTSPRRSEILKGIGVPFEAIPPAMKEEDCGRGCSPESVVLRLAEEKVRSVATDRGERILLGADTIVVAGESTILGKPRDAGDAASMLEGLSGKAHRVLTGIFLLHEALGREAAGVEETTVLFRPLSRKEIDRYVATGEPLDKAGSYGIQGLGGLFVDRIEGCYFNVVGLPVAKLGALLGELCDVE